MEQVHMQINLHCVLDHRQQVQSPVRGYDHQHHDGEAWRPHEGDSGAAFSSRQALCQVWHCQPVPPDHSWCQAGGGGGTEDCRRAVDSNAGNFGHTGGDKFTGRKNKNLRSTGYLYFCNRPHQLSFLFGIENIFFCADKFVCPQYEEGHGLCLKRFLHLFNFVRKYILFG